MPFKNRSSWFINIYNIVWCPASHCSPNCPSNTSPFVLPVWLQLLFPGRSVAAVLDAWASQSHSTLSIYQPAIVCSCWAHTAGWHTEGWHHNLQLLPSLLSQQLSARNPHSGSPSAPSLLASFLPSQVVLSVPGLLCRLFHGDSHGLVGMQRPQWGPAFRLLAMELQ